MITPVKNKNNQAIDVSIPDEILNSWQGIVNMVADMVAVPCALLRRFDGDDLVVLKSSTTERNPFAEGETRPAYGRFCGEVQRTGKMLHVPDALAEPKWANGGDTEKGMRSYLGYPVRWPDGNLFGAICVMDIEANRFGRTYQRMLIRSRELMEGHIGSLVRETVRAHVGDEPVVAAPTRPETDEQAREVDSLLGVLREAEERYRSLFEGAVDGIAIMDGDKVIECNEMTLRMFGFDVMEDIVGHSLWDNSPEHQPDGAPSKEKALEHLETVKAGNVINFQWENVRPDGSPLYTDVTLSPLRLAEGTVLVQAIIRDVTGLKKAEEEKKRFSTAVRMSSDGIVVVDLDNTIVDVNDAFVGMLGYSSKDNLLGTNGLDLISPEHHDKVLADMREAIKVGRAENLEYNFITKDGDELVLEMGASPMRDQNGRATGLVTICRNITDRKRRELEMRRGLMSFDMSEGNVYLVEEETPSKSLGAIRDLIKVGYKVRALSRTPRTEFPEDILASSEHLWISETGDEGCIRPAIADMEAWTEDLPRKQVIFIDRLDFIYSRNGARDTIGFIQRLRDLAHIKDHTVILSMDSATLDEKELRILEKETRELVPVHRTKLPEDLFDVLKYVYSENLTGRDPSHTDICAELDISKPTVRKRVKELIFSGYIKESVKGSKKVISVTEKGRRPFVKQ